MELFKEKKNKEELKFNQVKPYMQELTKGLNPSISIDSVLSEVQKKNKIDINENTLPHLLMSFVMSKSVSHPDYLILASRIFVSTLHKTTKLSFADKMDDLYRLNSASNSSTPLITSEQLQFIQQNKKRIEEVIDYQKDYSYSIFALTEFKQTLLARIDGNIIERPQDFLMRIAVGMHKDNIEETIKSYTQMSEGLFLYFPSYLPIQKTLQSHQDAPYSIILKEENISSLFGLLTECVQMTQSTKAIGVAVHDVPSKTFTSILNLFNETVNYINQTQEISSRPFTLYLEPWHTEIFNFLSSKDDATHSDLQISSLNRALWIPDLFMERVENNGEWTLMCPEECPGLSNIYGSEFETLYKKYEAEGKGKQTLKAQEIWIKILETQIEEGTIQLLFKDRFNQKSNDLQTTIKAPGQIEKESKSSHFVCLSLPQFIDENGFNFTQLYNVVSRIVRVSSSCTEYTIMNDSGLTNNVPVHIEVQGFPESLLKLNLPFSSEEATQINKEIFETIQYAASTASNNLAKEKGICNSREEDANWNNYFHLDLWNLPTSNRWSWMNLKIAVQEYGLYIPFKITCSFDSKVSRILGNNETSSPISSYVKTHKWSTSDALVIDPYLLQELIKNKVWSPLLLQEIIQYQGAIQNMKGIPASIREVYKTAWEISQKDLIDKIADRECLGVETPSIELFITNPNFSKLTSIYFYSWKKRLQTGIFSLRTKIDPQTMDFSIDKNIALESPEIK